MRGESNARFRGDGRGCSVVVLRGAVMWVLVDWIRGSE